MKQGVFACPVVAYVRESSSKPLRSESGTLRARLYLSSLSSAMQSGNSDADSCTFFHSSQRESD